MFPKEHLSCPQPCLHQFSANTLLLPPAQHPKVDNHIFGCGVVKMCLSELSEIFGYCKEEEHY